MLQHTATLRKRGSIVICRLSVSSASICRVNALSRPFQQKVIRYRFKVHEYIYIVQREFPIKKLSPQMTNRNVTLHNRWPEIFGRATALAQSGLGPYIRRSPGERPPSGAREISIYPFKNLHTNVLQNTRASTISLHLYMSFQWDGSLPRPMVVTR